jgi:Na+/H+ antiporter NhaA
MSIFTTTLAFNNDAFKDIAKIAILVSAAGSLGISWLNFFMAERKIFKYSPQHTMTADISL